MGATLLCALLWLALAAVRPALAAKRESSQVPWSVRVDVRWGTRKNREAYRSGLEHGIVQDLLQKACFERVVEGGRADLVLDVQLNDFRTEQEYDSSETLFPGQGEEHHLRAARASVNLDYRLRPEGKEAVEIVQGHVCRQLEREAQLPADPAEDRVLSDLTADASRWVVRELCDRRSRLVSKISEAMGSSGRP